MVEEDFMSIQAIALLVTIATTAIFTLLGVLYVSKQKMSLEAYVSSRNFFDTKTTIATMVASAMGAWILFSPEEAGSAFGGITAILGYCVASAAAVALFIVVGPRLRQLMPQGHSLTEYARYRYGAAMYWLTEAVMVFYMVVYLTAELTAIAKALNLIADVPLGVTALVVITSVFIYTTYGGIRVTFFTDTLQFLVIVPLLVICFGAIVASAGGMGPILETVGQKHPELLSFGNVDGWKFGATLIIAIVAAEFFNQGNWQRVYACKSDRVVRRAFAGATILVLPIIFLAGVLGIVATKFGHSGDTSLFLLLKSLAAPQGVLILVMILALALVMSTLDTLLNAIAAVFTVDIVRIFPQVQTQQILTYSRWLSVLVGIPSIWIASQGYSVLYLFLVADMVCAGVLFPVLWGLYSRRTSSLNALVSSIVGITLGTLYFQRPDFSPLVPIPGGGDLLVSFGMALGSSMVMVLGWNAIVTQFGKPDLFDFKRLQSDVSAYEDEPMADLTSVPRS
jgi:Na+/proline symporter